MTVFRLPADRLRAALLAGAVPPAVARRPVEGIAGPGEVWLRTGRSELVDFGATTVAEAPPLRLLPCWAVLVPLEPDGGTVVGPVLVPVTRVRGLPLEVRVADDGRAWAVLPRPPAGSDFYRGGPPGVWVRAGWRHPLPELLAAPVGAELLLDPAGGWGLVPTDGRPPVERFDLPRQPVPVVVPRRVSLPLRLVRGPRRPARLWVRPGSPVEVAAQLVAGGVERLDGLEAVAIGGDPERTLVRATADRPAPAGWADGFAPVDGVFLPVGRRALPDRLTGTAGQTVWFDESSGLARHAVADRFTPLIDRVRLQVPPAQRLLACPIASPLGLPPLPSVVRPPAPEPVGRPPAVSVPTVSTRVERPARTPRRAIAPSELPPVQTVRPLAAEGRLVAELPACDPTRRAGLWAELAAGYQAAGRPADAAGCWLNAVWEHPDPPAYWLRAWRVTEPAGVRAATAGLATGAIDPAAVRLLDARECDVPVRAVWLARRQIGDPLGLARCRDRLLARLAAGGPALDLDVPAFLRTVGRPTAVDAARTWLGAAGPVRAWVSGCVGGGRLVGVGLDADKAATKRYADLVRAWGLAVLGDRTALDVAAEAVAGLLAGRRVAGTDPTVHRLLAGGFDRRVRAALSGHPLDSSADDLRPLAPLDRYAVRQMRAGCGSLGGGTEPPPLDTPTGRLQFAADTARVRHQPVALRDLLAADPAVAARAAGPLFHAAGRLGLHAEAAELVGVLAARRPPPGGRRDLGLAVGRYAVGDTAGGDAALDAGRQRLFVTGVPDPRERGELAVAYATAVGFAAPRVVAGRLDELFRRLGPVSAQGACGRYFALLPLRVVDAAVRAAVGDPFAPSPAVQRFLADHELLTRRRIARDIKTVLGDVC